MVIIFLALLLTACGGVDGDPTERPGLFPAPENTPADDVDVPQEDAGYRLDLPIVNIPSMGDAGATEQVAIQPSDPGSPSPTPCIPSPPSGWVTYTIQPGDNLFRLALNVGSTEAELQAVNCIADQALIIEGATLYLPQLPPPPPPPPAAPPPQPTPTALAEIDIPEEAFIDLGGAGDPAFCPDPDNTGPTQQITISPRRQTIFELCLWGFPLGATVDLELVTPAGTSAGTTQVEIDETEGGWSKAEIEFWAPPGVPRGVWTAVVTLSGAETSGEFRITSFIEPTIATVPGGNINPLENKNCGPFSPGESVVINGAGFELEGGYWIAIYKRLGVEGGKFKLELIEELAAYTDLTGDFSVNFDIENSHQSTGEDNFYYAIAILDVEVLDHEIVDAHVDCFSVPPAP